MEFIITEIKQFSIAADTKEQASQKFEAGDCRLLHSQIVINARGVSGKPTTLLGPLPYEKWPIWAKAMRQFTRPSDKGIGDTIARLIGAENSDAFKSWFESTFNRPCGCTGRQAAWNLQYPLPGS